MIKIILILTLFVISLSANIGLVKTLTGTVNIKRIDKIIPLNIGTSINEGDIILTENNSSIGIVFVDGSRLALGSKSHIRIEKYLFNPKEDKYKFDLNMTKGTAQFESGEFGKKAPESVEFKVPEGIIGIRGTKFYVEIK